MRHSGTTEQEMRGRQFAVVVALLALGVAGVAVPAVGLDLAAQAQETEAEGLGTQMTSFAQSTAVDASSSVDTGMWEVRINQSDSPNRSSVAIQERTTTLEQRLATLENRTEQLSAANRTSIAYTGRATAVRAELANVRAQINETADVAQRRGVNTSKLGQLQARAGKVRGPEISESARRMTEPPRGPPDERPGNGPPDGNQGPPEDGQGPPDDDTGPPEERPGNQNDDPGQSNNQPGDDNRSGNGPDTNNGGGNSGGGQPGNSGS